MRAPAPGRPVTHNGPRPGPARALAADRRSALAGPRTEPELPIPQVFDGFEASRVSRAADSSKVSPLAGKDVLSAPEPDARPTPPRRKTLGRGAMGTAVRRLQRTLVRLGHLSHEAYSSGAGVFGPRTEQAVRAFQLQAGLSPTGQVDALTELALQQPLHR